MITVTNITIQTPTLFAEAYGTSFYNCGPYQEGCSTGATTTTPTPLPSAPNTGMLFSEPSFVIPGSLLLAVIFAFIATSITSFIRRKKRTY